MAIYHWESKVISRGKGRTACGAAAYMSCSRIYNDYDGVQHDYTRKGGLVWEHIFLPAMAPAEWQDRETLWNAVEANEKAKNSQLAREFIVALPIELEKHQWISLVSEFIQDHFVSDGMCADVAIHDTDGHNPHAHILLTMRPLNEDGTWQYKTEKEYLCVRDGEERGFTAAEFKVAQAEGWEKQYQYKVGKKKVYMTSSAAEAQGLERASKYPKSTKYGRQNPITARWNSEEQLIAWRAAWADAVNRALERIHCPERVDHRSHAERGLDEKPTIHEGYEARKLEKMGLVSERCELNRQIKADNLLILALKAMVSKLTATLKLTVPVVAEKLEQIRQNLIVYSYALLHNRGRREQTNDYLDKAKPAYRDFLALREKRKAKRNERRSLQTELETLSILNIRKRGELKEKIVALDEEIDRLNADIRAEVNGFGKANAAQMKEVKADITTAEVAVRQMDRQNASVQQSIAQSKAEFADLKAQAADLDQYELTVARLALRPQMEDIARERIQKGLSSGKVSFRKYEDSIRDADRILDDENITEQRMKEKTKYQQYEPRKAHDQSR